MSERKTRGRQRIPIQLIENKDELLVSFSKRRVGVYKKASELSTLCGVDVGLIIFSPSGIPHSFFTPDFNSVIYGRRNPDQKRDRYGRAVDCSSRIKIRELNEKLDKVIEEKDRAERREKQLEDVVPSGEMRWWEVPAGSLDAEQLKEQIEWFRALKAQIGNRVRELKNAGVSSHDGGGISGECFFAPLSLDGYDSGGGGGSSHVENQYLFPPHPPPYFDGGGGSSSVVPDQYLSPPPPPPPPPHIGCGSGLTPCNYYFAPPSLNLFGGGRDGGHYLGDGNSYEPQEGQDLYFPAAHGSGGAAPSRRRE